MKPNLLGRSLSLLLLGACATGGPSLQPRDVELARSTAAFAAERATAGEFSGVVLIAREGRPLLHEAFGLADREDGRPNTTTTPFNIASLGKMFTGVAVAQLVEQGKLRYDGKLGDYLAVGNRAIEESVTLHHLLTHTSGIPDLPESLFDAPPQSLSGYLPFLSGVELEFEPGSKRSYSNSGFVLLGMVIEQVTGERFPDRIEDAIFRPAGMSGAGFDPERAGSVVAALPYRQDEAGGWELASSSRHHGGPHGGAYATAADLMEFFESLRRGELLGRSAALTVTTPQQGAAAYGFGSLELGGERLFGHSGGDAGASADAYHYWTSGYSIVVLSNLGPPAAHRVAQYARRELERRFEGE